MRWITLPLVVLACVACSPGGGPEPDAGTAAELDIAGDWTETFECDRVCVGEPDDTITGLTSLTLTQDGTDIEREDGDGTSWTGTLSDTTLTVITMDGYDETSIFEFTVEEGGFTNNFTLTSEYSDADCEGVCTGTGERDDPVSS